MVVTTSGVDRHHCLIRLIPAVYFFISPIDGLTHFRGVGQVIHSNRQDPNSARLQFLRIESQMSALPHIIHVTVTSCIQPLFQSWSCHTQICVRNSDIAKSQINGLALQPRNILDEIIFGGLGLGHHFCSMMRL